MQGFDSVTVSCTLARVCEAERNDQECKLKLEAVLCRQLKRIIWKQYLGTNVGRYLGRNKILSDDNTYDRNYHKVFIQIKN